jgi:hypothetical protein
MKDRLSLQPSITEVPPLASLTASCASMVIMYCW